MYILFRSTWTARHETAVHEASASGVRRQGGTHEDGRLQKAAPVLLHQPSEWRCKHDLRHFCPLAKRILYPKRRPARTNSGNSCLPIGYATMCLAVKTSGDLYNRFNVVIHIHICAHIRQSQLLYLNDQLCKGSSARCWISVLLVSDLQQQDGSGDHSWQCLGCGTAERGLQPVHLCGRHGHGARGHHQNSQQQHVDPRQITGWDSLSLFWTESYSNHLNLLGNKVTKNSVKTFRRFSSVKFPALAFFSF